jgi:predicted lipid-binding transport protein (Tim44 family)
VNNSKQTQLQNTNDYPDGFDQQCFLRGVKVQFIRLQAAYDSKNLRDLREFTTPEVFAEIKMQIQERGDADNHTEVVNLNADLLDVATEKQIMIDREVPVLIASVRFSGSIREERHEAATTLNEIWHFRQDPGSSTWIVAGIQQS